MKTRVTFARIHYVFRQVFDPAFSAFRKVDALDHDFGNIFSLTLILCARNSVL
jgi:hypothetical protein